MDTLGALVGCGLIPAGAGSTPARATAGRRRGAHPRWRGEHWLPRGGLSNVEGSSPLARGAHTQNKGGKHGLGLIPAGAGSTLQVEINAHSSPAHPRWRGEHVPISVGVKTSAGSSPLARGAPERAAEIFLWLGLIPAGAGSTWRRWVRLFWSRAHPRWRGEHWLSSRSCWGVVGSSPLARGARLSRKSISNYERLIPAGAGSTSFFAREGTKCRGSSPLARGAPYKDMPPTEYIGLIPAGAGSTSFA